MSMEHEKMETRQERIAKLKKARAYERNSKWIGATLAVSLTAASVFVQPEEAKACDCAASYTVKEGDTIYSLAKKFQVSVEQLKSKNGFASNDLYVGQQMIVPTLDENGRPLHLTLMEQKKDYLENNGVHKESNEKTEPSIKPEEIKTGSTPSGKSTEAPVAVAAMEKLDQTVTKVTPQQTKISGSFNHVVQSGDSLWKIANKYGTTVEKIRQDNQLKTDALQIGQKLIITPKGSTAKPGAGQKPAEQPKPPAPSGSTVTHIVQSGDSLWKIANKYGTTVEKIKQDNQLKTNALQIGQKLIITPKGSAAKPGAGQKPTEQPKPPAPSGSTVTHIVQSGDSLWKIANKYGTTVEKIRQDNRLKTDALKIGQKLIITPKGSAAKPGAGQKPTEQPKPPAPSGSTVTHIVQSGDSLWKIANKYGTTVEKIRQDNQLKTDALKIGQKLIIYKNKEQTNKKEPGKIPGQKITQKPKQASSTVNIVKNDDSLSILTKKLIFRQKI
ncbi:hypothetical protein CJ483_17160 [Bacillus sp. PK3_68]|nr:hypothetical protein CJ483_17160 [Bacillus sp. PK3_68]